MTTIGLFGAFLAGVLALLSPCSALLLPAFFAYAFQSKRDLLLRTAVFLAGLTVVLVPIGVAASSVGRIFTENRESLITIGGWVIILLGIYTFMGFGFRIPGLSSLNNASWVRGTGFLPVFFLGCVYGFAGFCAGPMLGAVLTTAAMATNIVYASTIMFCYALGMSVPLFFLAALWDRWDIGSRSFFRGKTFSIWKLKFNTMSMLAGLLFIAIGILFLRTQGTGSLAGIFGIDTQFRIQNSVADFAQGVPNLLLIIIILLLVELWLGYRIMKRRNQARHPESPERHE